MSEVLSQSQIDALLNGITTGEVSINESPQQMSKVNKEYNFRSPKKFTKERLKLISSLYEAVARQLATYLSGTLRYFTEIEVVSIEEQRYHEFSNVVHENVLVGMYQMNPQDPYLDDMLMLFDLGISVGYFLIDRLLGGTGYKGSLDRLFTELEVEILRSIVNKVREILQDTWNEYVVAEITTQSIETNSRLMQGFLPDDIVIIVVFDVKIKDFESRMTLCLPALQLEDYMAKIDSANRGSTKKKQQHNETEKKQFMLSELYKSKLEVKAILGEIELGVQDVLALKENDIIPLTRHMNDSVDILIEGIPWLRANVGQTKVKKAVRICNYIDEKG